ncbi:alpha-1,3-arabinosyltransferase XAT3-like [Neltuma alba]|uniref:alpha-1,3-arabinosyltransferase XAT3-like n=1 Tax=Neltuma alba TaxID=207710 RepID=UPI0010A4B7CD|nr:alpha-1,3-arabinosyltransferase XAT3-like [Prosopis alba]
MNNRQMRGFNFKLPSLPMVALLFFAIFVTAQIQLSAIFSLIFSSSSSSSSSDIPFTSSLSNHSATSTDQPPLEKARGEISCDRTSIRYDLCNIRGPTVVDPTTAAFYIMGPTGSNKPKIVEKIKPYPRKFDDDIMPEIKEVTLISGPKGPKCEAYHNAPALVFSATGYTGNFFHDFNDGFIPLFITVNTIFPNHQDFVIVLSEGSNWWHIKYIDLLNIFSKHPVIFLNNETKTHCFPSAHIGLISHGFMTINNTLLPNSKTYLHFHDAIHKAYGNHHNQILSPKDLTFRPQLVLVSRKGAIGRVILNQEEVIRDMEEVGFDVIVFEPTENTSLHESYALVSSCHAMIGVHGAALMHSLFLRPGSVFMQIVPIGVEWAAKTFFGRVGKGLKLEYMEYHIEVEESSLVGKYGKDSVMLRNPSALQKGGWPIELMDIYLKEQNVKLDLVRFRGYLEDAYKRAYKFMHRENWTFMKTL